MNYAYKRWYGRKGWNVLGSTEKDIYLCMADGSLALVFGLARLPAWIYFASIYLFAFSTRPCLVS